MPFDWGSYGEYCYFLDHTAPALPSNPAHNISDPILCVCQNYLPCGCDNKSGQYTIPSSAKYSIINGTEYAIVNGTLQNGTTLPTQTGGAKSSGIRAEAHLTALVTGVLWLVGMFLGGFF